jgi:hypothetical protein
MLASAALHQAAACVRAPGQAVELVPIRIGPSSVQLKAYERCLPVLKGVHFALRSALRWAPGKRFAAPRRAACLTDRPALAAATQRSAAQRTHRQCTHADSTHAHTRTRTRREHTSLV